MPPAKKQKKDEAASLSPKDAHFKRLEKAITDHRCKGSMLVVGIDREDDEDDEEDEDDSREYTTEQISTLRHILINDSRDKALTRAQKFVSCGQTGGFAMFGTHDGSMICFGIPREIKKALKKATVPQQFDELFALTYSLNSFDFWMHDNECWEKGGALEKAMKALGKAWRDMLKQSDAVLGIDAEYTRPGIEALLTKLTEEFEGCEATEDLAPFKWR